MPLVRASINLKEAAHFMGKDGEILFTITPTDDGRGVLIDFDNEPVEVKIGGRTYKEPMGLEIKATS